MSWYRDPHPVASGYWGPITSTLVWCEQKYRWSYYVAEPINTATNAFFIALSLYGFLSCRRQALPLRFALCHLGVALVGFGSAWFHATLLYSTQLLDELPMIYTSALLTYCVFETSPSHLKPRFRILLPWSLFAMVAWITAVYLRNGNPVFHQSAYAAIQILSTLRVIYLLTNTSSPLTSAAGKARKREITRLYLFGAVIFLTGFAVWNVDNIFCAHLRAARQYVGYPWAVLLEGHGWWHILTGYGAYSLITAGSLLALCYKEDPANFELTQAAFPIVKRLKPYSPPKARRKIKQ
jgi:dihydroceramidase